VNCAETIPDTPGQPAYEMFVIKRRFQQCMSRPPRFKESSVQMHQIWVPLKNSRFLLLSSSLARERLQIDFPRIITSTADELQGGTNIDDLERPWTPKKGFLVNFFRDLRWPHTFQEWTASKSLEIDQETCGRNFQH